MSVGDLRSAALEQRREKEHRVKYRGVNVGLIGRPVSEWFPDQKVRSSSTWNSNNKFRMRDMVGKTCHCVSCKQETAKMNRRKHPRLDIVDVVCTGSTHIARKAPRPVLNHAEIDDFRDMDSGSSEEEYDDQNVYMEGIAYSFDNAGPGNELALSHAVTQAVEKFHSKELAMLVKNEYEFVNESDTDEDFELI
ncbi:hypothetical protein BDD12DRAFT_736571 [Trichophaea hybrida]|nr:hypothetical protein BDD12DRAFT_736571 [Trichophaea hybrida]